MQKYLRVTGVTNVDYSTWAAVGDSTIALCVDDPVATPDDSATYLQASNAASTAKNGYLDFEAFVEPNRSINSVTPVARNSLGGGGGGGTYTAKLYFRGKAAYTDHLWWTLAGAYANWVTRTATPYTTCPDTGVAWVPGDLSAPQVKVNSSDTVNVHRHLVTSAYTIVDYNPRGGVGGRRRWMACLVPLVGSGLGMEHVPQLASHLWKATGLAMSAEEWRQALEVLRGAS